ncbi:MAG: acyl-CoA thioesterase [Nitriliruptorales bacterium]
MADDIELSDPSVHTAWVTERIRFSDTDAMGHVNNIAIAAYFESGRIAMGMEIAGSTPHGAHAFTLARLTIDYRAELHYPGEVRVGSRVLRVGRTSYTMGSALFTDGDRCTATSESVVVMLGPDGPHPIEGDLRQRLEELAAR